MALGFWLLACFPNKPLLLSWIPLFANLCLGPGLLFRLLPELGLRLHTVMCLFSTSPDFGTIFGLRLLPCLSPSAIWPVTIASCSKTWGQHNTCRPACRKEKGVDIGKKNTSQLCFLTWALGCALHREPLPVNIYNWWYISIKISGKNAP